MPAQEDYASVNEFADRLGLDGEDRESFITSSMKRLGYKPRMDWDDPDPDEGKGDEGGDFFTRKQKQRQSREVGGGQQRGQQQKRTGSGAWGYD